MRRNIEGKSLLPHVLCLHGCRPAQVASPPPPPQSEREQAREEALSSRRPQPSGTRGQHDAAGSVSIEEHEEEGVNGVAKRRRATSSADYPAKYQEVEEEQEGRWLGASRGSCSSRSLSLRTTHEHCTHSTCSNLPRSPALRHSCWG
eukprot:765787-Hanusia_phi.AAC.3